MAMKRTLPRGRGESSAKKTHWSQGLRASMDDPSLRIDADDLVVIIRDKFPKAQHHYLVLPKENIPSLKALNRNHIALIKHMHERGKALAESYSDHSFQIGYHAIPSMSHIHLHVISQDFDSTCLKTKKHWNSFTTPYFVDAEDVLQQLEDTGSVHDTSPERGKMLLDEPLKCHKCNFRPANMPKLKSHIKTHIVRK